MNLTAGKVLQGGKYILHEPLSQGKVSCTFKATQTFLNRFVVIKTIQPNPRIPVDFVQRKRLFAQEVRSLATCHHPGFASILDFFEEAGCPFVVLDYVTGQSLADWVQLHGPLSEAIALQYIRQVGSALSVIHRNGLTHRDVKPENMVRPAGANFVILVDFGISYPADLGIPLTSLPVHPYTAPELASQSSITAAADVYSLAASLYFLVTGQAPIAAVLRNQTAVIPPRQLQPHLSVAIEAAIVNGMEISCQARSQTIAAWFALLPDAPPLPPVHEFASSIQPLHRVGERQASTHSNGSSIPTNLHPTTAKVATQVVASPIIRQTTSRGITPSANLAKSLVLTSLVTAVLGVGLGLMLRTNGATGPGSGFFHAEQAFPPLPDWPNDEKSTVTSATPVSPSKPLIKKEVLSESQPEPIIPPKKAYSRPRLAPTAPKVVAEPTAAPTAEPIAEPTIMPTLEAAPVPTLPTPTTPQTAADSPISPTLVNPQPAPSKVTLPKSAEEPPMKQSQQKEPSSSSIKP